MNKVDAAIRLVKDKLATSNISKEVLADLGSKLAIEPDERVVWQETKTWAALTGLITMDEAVDIYRIMGNWSKQPTATKIAITGMMQQLLKLKIEKED